MSLEACVGWVSWALVLREEVVAWLRELREGEYQQVLAAREHEGASPSGWKPAVVVYVRYRAPWHRSGRRGQHKQLDEVD